ncbi:MAG: hypothetical protein WAT39_24565 [Planctomycetota bacterium]
MRRSPIALLLAALASAQTFVVDAAGGPGSQFTSIAAAVAAVPNGAVLLVLPGTYAPFTIAGKGLTILGQGGVVISGPFYAPIAITVSGTAAMQSVVLRDLVLSVPLGGSYLLSCSNCQGLVMLQRVSVDQTYGFPRELRAQQCRQLYVEQSGPFWGSGIGPGNVAIDVATSDVTLVDSDAPNPGGLALRANGSTVQVVDSAWAGGGLGGPAIVLTNTSLRVAGNSTLNGYSGAAAIAISGTGTAVVDPAATLVGTVSSGVNFTLAGQGVVTAAGGTIGTLATATMRGPAGHLGVLYLGLPAAPTPIAGFQHQAWLAAGGFVAGAVGVFGPPLASSLAVPMNPLLRGTVWAWQGATFDAASGFAISTPALFTP